MEVKFYILGSSDHCGTRYWVEGPLEEFPGLEYWRTDEYVYQYYKAEKV